MSPDLTPVTCLTEGQVGYMIANMRKASDAQIGDTVCLADCPVEPLPGFKEAQPMVRSISVQYCITADDCYNYFLTFLSPVANLSYCR